MVIGKIYKISNNFDQNEYIGQTWDTLEFRFKTQLQMLLKNWEFNVGV